MARQLVECVFVNRSGMCSSETTVTPRQRNRFVIGVVRWERVEQARRLTEVC